LGEDRGGMVKRLMDFDSVLKWLSRNGIGIFPLGVWSFDLRNLNKKN